MKTHRQLLLEEIQYLQNQLDDLKTDVIDSDLDSNSDEFHNIFVTVSNAREDVISHHQNI